MKHAVLSNLNGTKNKLVKVKLISKKWNVTQSIEQCTTPLIVFTCNTMLNFVAQHTKNSGTPMVWIYLQNIQLHPSSLTLHSIYITVIFLLVFYIKLAFINVNLWSIWEKESNIRHSPLVIKYNLTQLTHSFKKQQQTVIKCYNIIYIKST